MDPTPYGLGQKFALEIYGFLKESVSPDLHGRAIALRQLADKPFKSPAQRTNAMAIADRGIRPEGESGGGAMWPQVRRGFNTLRAEKGFGAVPAGGTAAGPAPLPMQGPGRPGMTPVVSPVAG